MQRLIVRSAVAAIAIAAAALGSVTVASAAPNGPCEEVTYVGVCGPVREQQQNRTSPQQSMDDVVVPGLGNNPLTLG
ncbi:hypothetical protein BST36_08360 [Mycolicibacterium moriokaense]|jgi:hypothetical protein|uniref:Secreted protein n=1 Tax=Mycolicibacterium moriokaense TaxID=39691 RepID=A0AAD1M9L4_9MYCO|nr:hypothetical protein BST36_08360 [Mycolicibacterium moriokaense]BBX04756.1 hypothetical protein MMOR_56920 [Mycolicibacterium moriokaense]